MSRDASKSMGELLLKGWTMLEDSCIDCQCPLMRNKNMEKLCCSCGKWFNLRDAEGNMKAAAGAAGPSPSVASSVLTSNPEFAKMKDPQSLSLQKSLQQQPPKPAEEMKASIFNPPSGELRKSTEEEEQEERRRDLTKSKEHTEETLRGD